MSRPFYRSTVSSGTVLSGGELRVNGYQMSHVDVDSVGDWGGREQLAADRLTALLLAVADASLPRYHNRWTCDPQFFFDATQHVVFDLYASNPDLIELRGSDIKRIARRFALTTA